MSLATHIEHVRRQGEAARGRTQTWPIRAILGGVDVEPYLAEAAAQVSGTQDGERPVLVVETRPERGTPNLPADAIWVVCAEGQHLVSWWSPRLTPEQLELYEKLRGDGHNIERAEDLAEHLVPNSAPGGSGTRLPA